MLVNFRAGNLSENHLVSPKRRVPVSSAIHSRLFSSNSRIGRKNSAAGIAFGAPLTFLGHRFLVMKRAARHKRRKGSSAGEVIGVIRKVLLAAGIRRCAVRRMQYAIRRIVLRIAEKSTTNRQANAGKWVSRG